MHPIYFTFKTFNRSGIGDQLGAQFSHLYSLGHQCGWTYVHLLPFDFDRRTLGSKNRNGLPHIVEYLGLHTTDPRPSIDYDGSIHLSMLIGDASSIEQVRNNMQLFIDRSVAVAQSGTSGSFLLSIELGDRYHTFIPTILRLTGMNWAQTLQFAGTTYLQGKRENRMCFSRVHPIAVAHIRIGDSVRIDTAMCPLILHGGRVYTSLEQYQQEIGSTDPSRARRISFRPFDFLETIKTLMKAHCIQADNLYLVSDGFNTTKQCIYSHILHRRLSLNIGILALREVSKLERMFARAIKFIPLSQRVIGEDPQNTLMAIELFSRASLLMSNAGGFSYTIYNIYNPNCSRADSFVWL